MEEVLVTSGQFHQSLTGLPQLFCHTSVSRERAQWSWSAVDEVTPVVPGCLLRHSAVDDSLSSHLTGHEKHPHDHLHQHPEQDGEVGGPTTLNKPWRDTRTYRRPAIWTVSATSYLWTNLIFFSCPPVREGTDQGAPHKTSPLSPQWSWPAPG